METCYSACLQLNRHLFFQAQSEWRITSLLPQSPPCLCSPQTPAEVCGLERTSSADLENRFGVDFSLLLDNGPSSGSRGNPWAPSLLDSVRISQDDPLGFGIGCSMSLQPKHLLCFPLGCMLLSKRQLRISSRRFCHLLFPL